METSKRARKFPPAQRRDGFVFARVIHSLYSGNRRFPSCLEPHLESEATCRAFHLKIRFHQERIKV